MPEAMRPDLSGVDPLTVNLTHRVCIGDLPTRASITYGERPALVDDDTTVSYVELERLANAVARGLQAAGLARGDRLAIQVQNRWQNVVTFLACAKLGVIALPLNLALAPTDIAYQLADSGSVALVTEDALLPAAEAALRGADHEVRRIWVVGSAPETVGDVPAVDWTGLTSGDGSRFESIVEDRDIVHCLYTSGTTSLPKGVLTSHVAVQLSALSAAVALGLRPDVDAGATPLVLPLFHVTALDALLLPALLAGSTVILHRGFDPAAVAADFGNHAVTHLTMLPAMWAALLAQPALAEGDTDSLVTGLYAMAPMPAPLLGALRERFPNAAIILGSGQTETTPASQVQWSGHQGVKDDSWGPAVAATEVQIMGPKGELLPRGVEGEIVYRTPQLMEGYWHNADANAEAFAHGWFHGGDIGYLDEDGVVWFTDRAKDIVKTGGENVSSVEVERVVLAHESVAECAVVGRPDERWGEAVTAYVVPAEGATIDAEALREHCKQHLAGFKVPKAFEQVEALPKTATGKIRKVELR
ncbi:class I adenylate-forming enzyme family protein [Flexivirga meconopsidis]|uniref:class I adenylate-forming enzyme family protein n=1 Tax=Flexivirga meconopsidis TaxID=2977121 RepID=UPI00223EB0BA|nr:AMP-binding protein [Flexivirga meconopsidis]